MLALTSVEPGFHSMFSDLSNCKSNFKLWRLHAMQDRSQLALNIPFLPVLSLGKFCFKMFAKTFRIMLT